MPWPALLHLGYEMNLTRQDDSRVRTIRIVTKLIHKHNFVILHLATFDRGIIRYV